jgi:hypothetical protein
MSAAPTAELESLRADIAAARGLGADAASFLRGTTLEEIEASADALARVLGRRDDRGDQPPAVRPGLFTEMAAAKTHRKQALAALLCGRAPQPRDELGRYARRGSFDGGARQPIPIHKSPEQAHGELIGQLVALRRISGDGASF